MPSSPESKAADPQIRLCVPPPAPLFLQVMPVLPAFGELLEVPEKNDCISNRTNCYQDSADRILNKTYSYPLSKSMPLQTKILYNYDTIWFFYDKQW